MTDSERAAGRERMRIALDLYELGEAIERQNLRRQFSDATEEESEARVFEWLCRRPGAEYGDAVGRGRFWP